MYFRFVKMEETWYYMKGKSIWTYQYMLSDPDYWHESIKNKYNGNDAGPSTSSNVKEEDDCENGSVSSRNVKEEKVEPSSDQLEEEDQPSTSIEGEMKVETPFVCGEIQFAENHVAEKG